MHEWSLAECVVSSLIKKLPKDSSEIKEIKITIGKLQNIDLEIFTQALKELFKTKSYKIKNIKIEEKEVEFKCRNCGKKFKPYNLDEYEKEMIHFLPELCFGFLDCPYCKSCDYEIKEGRELKIDYIEL